MKTALLCSVMIILFGNLLFAAVQVDVSVRDLSLAQGLSQSTVFCVYKDSRGLLWIGTQGGLNVYNGNEIRRFKHDPDNINSIPSDEVYSVAEDNDGNLLIGTINGLANLNPATGEVNRYKTDQPESEESLFYMAILKTRDGSFWIASYNGVNSFDPADGKLGTRLQIKEGVQKISRLYEDSRGRIWFGTKPASIYSYDPASDQTRRIVIPEQFRSPVPQDQQLYRFSICELMDGRMLVGASLHGLYFLDPVTGEFEQVSSQLNEIVRKQSVLISDVVQDESGQIWVATFGAGLFRISPQGEIIQAYDSSNKDMFGLYSDNLLDLFIDERNTLWVGTVDRGVAQVQFKDFEHLTYAPDEKLSLSEKVSISVFEDSEGILWVGHFHSLDRIDFQNHTSTTFEQLDGPGGPYLLNNISCVRELDSDTLLLTGYPLGMLRVDKKTMQAEKISSSALVFNVQWQEPLRAWYSAIDGGFFRIDLISGQQEQFIQLGDSGIDLSSRFVICVLEDRSGNVWIGTNDGLFSFDYESEIGRSYRYDPENLTSEPAVRSNDIISINEDSAGRIWVSTGSGLYGLRDGKVVHEFSTANGLPDNMVYSSAEDAEGSLWVGTNNGMVRLDPDSGDAIEYQMEHGLPTREFNQAAAYRSASGLIYFGTMNGVVWFDPSAVKQSTFEPPVIITGITAGDRDYNIPVYWQDGEDQSLPWEERDLTFSFSALDFSNPELVSYRYQLGGYDSAWRYAAGAPMATYTNVPAGTYTFRVQATNADGIWGSKEANFHFRMSPPWWGSWWFIGLQIVAAVALFFAAVYITTTHSRRQKITLEKKVAEATKELRAQHEELTIANRELEMFNYSVSHDLRSPLHVMYEYSSILVDDFSDKLDDPSRDMLLRINKSARRMNTLFESLLTLSQVNRAELNRDTIDLSMIAIEIVGDLKALDRDRIVDYRIEKGVSASCDENLMRIVMQNLLENAWKFTGKQDKPVIEFGAVMTNNDSRHFYVRDNGIGFDMSDAEQLFDPFKRLASGKDFPGTGVGLATVQRAVHRHGGRVWAEGHQDTGATFYFSLGG